MIRRCITLFSLALILSVHWHPGNKFWESAIYHGYAKAGSVEISIPILHETKEAQPTFEVSEVVNTTAPSYVEYDLTKPTKGMQLGNGFVVTSPQGWRTHPVHGTKRMHNGVDAAKSAAGGEHIYAPGKVEVYCKEDYVGGGGDYAEYEFNGMIWQALHLQKGSCVPGGHEKGWVIGKIGNTGVGTGPHLHLQLRNSANRREFLLVGLGHVKTTLGIQ